MSTGMLLGKFLPPHAGHKYLIDFARNYVDELTVQVCPNISEPIPGSLRYEWMKRSFGGVNMVYNDDPNPPTPEDDPENFWDIWKSSLLSRMDRSPDFVFASEPYGFRLAEVLGAEYVPVDHGRELVPISGSAILRNPMKYWDYLLPEARPYFLKRVALVGPESSGKSTLTANLACHYNTCFAAEYGRSFLEVAAPPLDSAETFLRILRGHRASEEAIAVQCNRLLFSDTESIVTKLWAEVYLGFVPEEVETALINSRYDLYLVMDATVDWVQDGGRIQSVYEDRKKFALDCEHILKNSDRNYVVLRGSWKERQAQAITAVDSLLVPPSPNNEGAGKDDG